MGVYGFLVLVIMKNIQESPELNVEAALSCCAIPTPTEPSSPRILVFQVANAFFSKYYIFSDMSFVLSQFLGTDILNLVQAEGSPNMVVKLRWTLVVTNHGVNLANIAQSDDLMAWRLQQCLQVVPSGLATTRF